MTAICGGGASGPKPNIDLALQFSSGRIIQLLAARGLGQFSIVVPLLGTIPTVLSQFCGNDPPAMVTLTSDEADALLQLKFGEDLTNGLGKLKDIVLNLLWMDVCQCTSGALVPPTIPSTPADAPHYVPPVLAPGTPTVGPFIPMLRSQTKVLALGCGTPTRPTGWQYDYFDDSAWVTGVAPAGISRTWAQGGQPGTTNKAYSQNTELSITNSLPGTIEAVGPASPIPHNCEQFLVRWRVYIPDVVPEKVIFRVGSFAQAGPGWGSGAAWLGTTSNVMPTGSSNFFFLSQRIVPNAWNLFAFDVNPSNTSSANTWGTEGGIFFGLDWTGATNNPNITPCCPPDVTTQAYLDSILSMVTLIQRQAAPFSYVYGANHIGLSGEGEIDVQGLIGCSVDVTTLPASYGVEFGTPDLLYDLGRINLGTVDGYTTSRRIDHDGTLFLPSAAGVFTKLGYSLQPGVEVNIRELVREP